LLTHIAADVRLKSHTWLLEVLIAFFDYVTRQFQRIFGMMAGTVETSISDPVSWVDEHGDFLYNYALGQLRDAGDAEDVVQETFLAALKAQNGFAGRSSERTWLVSILRHKVCDRFRRRYRERCVSCDSQPTKNGVPCIEESMLWVHETAAECLLPDRRMELNELRSALESALGLLPARIAQAFTMYEVEEYSGREVCHRMEISEANLWVMLHRARKQLRSLLPRWRSRVQGQNVVCNRPDDGQRCDDTG
jgi:RNA polymerase sigma-70 factor, ECF subfamily